MRKPRLAALVTVAMLMATACSDGDGGNERRAEGKAVQVTTTTEPPTTAPPETTTTTAPAPALPKTESPPAAPPPAPAPAQAPPAPAGSLAWRKCGGLQCATLTVPMDYENLAGPTIGLALIRKPAGRPSARIGSLLINPGGPGTSGVDNLPNQLRSLTPALQARFDIVSWDPRGIGRSAPVECEVPAEPAPPGAAPADDRPIDPAPTAPEDQQRLADSYAAYGRNCHRGSGDILIRRVGARDTAQDLERIRQALGDEKLTFIGHSAGTLIGATYAERYPDRVRAMLLDGPIDPSRSLDQMTADQAVSFERTLGLFLNWCVANPGSCAWRPQGDPKAAILSLIERIRREPLPAPNGEKVGYDKFINGMMGRLYTRSRWSSLGSALAAAARNDGAPLADLADRYVNGGSSNAAEARQAILCLDHPAPRSLSDYPPLVDAVRSQAPVFGPIFMWSVLSCGMWPVPATLPARPVRAAGAPPIVVVGTTGDPATPQAWAESLANQFEQGVLVLRQGEEHVAYFYSSCVRSLADAYLIDLRPPGDPTTCRS